MKPFYNIIQNCKKAQELSIKNEHTSLSFSENLRLKTHLASCSVCTKFIRQSALIDKAIQRLLQQSSFTLSNQKKQALQEMIDDLK